MNGKIIRLYENDFDKVDEFLSKNFSSPTHWQDWNKVISKYFNTDFFYFVLIEQNKILGICPAHSIKEKIKTRLISGPKEYLMPYGGWIFGKDVNSVSIKLKKNESLEIFSLPLIDEFNAKYSQKNVWKNYETTVLDLNMKIDDIWNSIERNRRNKIRKAIKNDVMISVCSEYDLREFYTFYAKANKQYGLKNLPYDYFNDLLIKKENITIDILSAKINDEVLGYNIIISDKDYSIYWMGIRFKDSVNNGFFDLLQWESIKKSKERNCKYYDLCYVEKERLPNIYKFKIDYSDNLIPIANIIIKPITYRIINKIQKIF
jgi:hypothetical protein